MKEKIDKFNQHIVKHVQRPTWQCTYQIFSLNFFSAEFTNTKHLYTYIVYIPCYNKPKP